MRYAPAIARLIEEFKKLPGVGPRAAERHVFYLLKSGKKPVDSLLFALNALRENIKSCQTCWDFSDSSPCRRCSDQKRDHSLICLISESMDISVIEKSGEFNGVFHVLRGHYYPEDEDQTIKIKELLSRLKDDSIPIKEVLIALSADIEGETTALFVEQQIKSIGKEIKVTRLARGLPLGADLQYADEITLKSAIKNRTEI